jgi:uncharacterized 2Fe-2S/4Fe-4S cluster protein (DUF4445 family)
VRKLEVTFRPFDQVTRVPEGTTLFNAAHWIGLPIESTCGGRGTCGKCKVQVLAGEVEVAPADRRWFSDAQLAEGWRLACEATLYADAECHVPALMRAPKAATMGLSRFVLLEPNVHKVHLALPEPSLEDVRSDVERLRDTLDAEGYGVVTDLRALRHLPIALRNARYDVTAVLCGEHLVAVEPGDTTGLSYGVAVDVGTTTVVATLMDLTSGVATAVASNLNGQAPFGADVISRIARTRMEETAAAELQRTVVETIDGLLAQVYSAAGVSSASVYEMVVAGNATMLHLLLGVDAHAISVAPFIPAFREPLDLPTAALGVDIHPEGRIQILPSLGAYVGADIVAGIQATGLTREPELRLFVDVGTNGEIVLGNAERVLASAAPAGPTFEGGHVKHGMRAADGAIESVVLDGAEVRLQVIGDAAPIGLCGSGLIDAVAQLRLAGLLDASGRLARGEDVPDHPLAERLVQDDGVRAFALAEGITLTQRDIRELQSAKGAIATGIAALMELMGVTADDLEQVLLAGSFGTYIDPQSARVIGLVPPVPVERIVAAGNAAGEGAKMALLSFREREMAFGLSRRVEYVELSGRPGFNEAFIGSVGFPDLEAVT